ncbi:unnamed protein product [Rangifer tarandus platyrhynchus]|uniref:Uncharacterized protein n=1 Tax=Rangifer tarandus platyrhynchus TaxID=3082113 RepID=A0AC59YJ93_RANTA
MGALLECWARASPGATQHLNRGEDALQRCVPQPLKGSEWSEEIVGWLALDPGLEALASAFDGAQQLGPAQQFLTASPPTKQNSGQISREMQSSHEHPAQSETQGTENSHSLKPNGGKKDLQ